MAVRMLLHFRWREVALNWGTKAVGFVETERGAGGGGDWRFDEEEEEEEGRGAFISSAALIAVVNE